MTPEKTLIKMREYKKEPCSFRINSLLLEKFKKAAAKAGISQSNYIENLIFAGLIKKDEDLKKWLS